jgi:hypothetical protein
VIQPLPQPCYKYSLHISENPFYTEAGDAPGKLQLGSIKMQFHSALHINFNQNALIIVYASLPALEICWVM